MNLAKIGFQDSIVSLEFTSTLKLQVFSASNVPVWLFKYQLNNDGSEK